MNTRNQLKGISMVLIAGLLWGLSGNAAQLLFQTDQVSPIWLAGIRTGVSGIILLIFSLLSSGPGRTFAIWRNPSHALRILIFGVIGLLGVQYTYFLSISLGNAAVATLLQYLSPALIVAYFVLRTRKMPTRREVLAIVLTIGGTLLLVTDGQFKGLSVPVSAVLWGLVSAVLLAFYTVFPKPLLKAHGAVTVTTWAMLLGSFPVAFIAPPWHFHGHSSWTTWLLVAFVVLLGTLVAFYLYLESLAYLSATETNLFACVEPLAATVVSVLFLHVRMGIVSILGGVCIVAMVILLSLKTDS